MEGGGKMARLYNIPEAADQLGRQVRTIRQWIHDGKIKAIKPPNKRHWMISEDEVERIRRLNCGNGDQ
jgi:excisionase family DNA binding protein